MSRVCIGLINGVFANGLEVLGSILGQVIQKTQKKKKKKKKEKYLMPLCLTHHKVRIKGKVEQSREWSSALLYTSVY